jgi:hypothetical protein
MDSGQRHGLDLQFNRSCRALSKDFVKSLSGLNRRDSVRENAVVDVALALLNNIGWESSATIVGNGRVTVVAGCYAPTLGR